MTELEQAMRRVFPISRQLAEPEVRRRALASARVGSVVQAVDPETHEVVRTGRVTAVDEPKTAECPGRWWCFDEHGRECHSWGEVKTGGLLMVRTWLAPEEAERLVRQGDSRPRPPFSWGLYEQHMEALVSAIGRGDLELPEEPWA